MVGCFFLARAYEYGRQKVNDDFVDDEYSYQEYDFQGASGFSFGGVKADVIDGEDSLLFFFTTPCNLILVYCPRKIGWHIFFNTWNKPIAKNKWKGRPPFLCTCLLYLVIHCQVCRTSICILVFKADIAYLYTITQCKISF